MAALNLSLLPKTLSPIARIHRIPIPCTSGLIFLSCAPPCRIRSAAATSQVVRALADVDYSSRRSGSSGEEREKIMLPGCDYNHWLIVMEFPKDPALTREQMIDTYLDTLATVLGSMEEAKKNMYAFSTTTYTGFQCTVLKKHLKNLKEISTLTERSFPASYPTYELKQSRSSKHKSKAYVRQRDGPPADKRRSGQEITPESDQKESKPESDSPQKNSQI